MGVCSVIGCQSRSFHPTGGGKHFFRFPKENLKNNKIRENWIYFTRRINFTPKDSSFICEDHFKQENLVTKKKGRLYLVKDSVPTVYLKEMKNKVEKIEVPYDPTTQEYLGTDNFFSSFEEKEKELLSLRDEKVLKARSLCRFCLESDKNVNCVSINKLYAFLKDSDDCLKLLDIDTQYNELFSEIVCEKCFHVLVDFDAYRKICRKTQNDFVQEIQEIDEKIEEIRGSQKEHSIWYKQEMMDEIMEDVVEEVEHNFELIEEHLDENFEENPYEQTYSGYTIEEIKENQSEDDIIVEEGFIGEKDSFKVESDELCDFDGKNVKEKEVIKNPDQNAFAYRIYECFFCKNKFAGRKTFKSHNCQVKEVKCEVSGCDRIFTKQSGYNQHMIKIHRHMKTSKHFCAICKEVINSTEEQFKLHRRQCSRELLTKEQVIECEVCKKVCKNLKSYTVHKMFHDTRNISKSDELSPKKTSLGKGPVICELCGNKFTNSQGLRTHKKNVHLIGSTGEVYECDICSKIRPTKRSLFNHMRNVHRVQKTPCTVCGKVFRTKALLQKHAMYHDETKRIHFCPMCPDKPGYFTAVALRRHQKSHHIGLKPHQCEFCETSYTTSHMLKQHQMQHHDVHE